MASSCRRRGRAATSCSIKQAADALEDHVHPVAALDPHAAAQWPQGVSLLRPVRTRLRHPRELLVAVGAAAAGAGHGTPHAHHPRDGARGHDRRDRPGHRRRLHRHRHRPREPRPRADRGAGGQRVRVGAAAAQLDVVTLSARPGERERHGGPLPDRHHRRGRERLHPEDDARRAAQRGRRRRHAPLHAVVARQPHARLPARVSHRDRRRAADAGRGVPRRHPSLHVAPMATAADRPGRLRQGAQGRLPALLRRDGRASRAAAR